MRVSTADSTPSCRNPASASSRHYGAAALKQLATIWRVWRPQRAGAADADGVASHPSPSTCASQLDDERMHENHLASGGWKTKSSGRRQRAPRRSVDACARIWPVKSHISFNICDRGPVARNIWFDICDGSRSIRSASSRRGRQVEVSSSRASRRRCAACAVVSAIGMAVSAIGMAARVNAPQVGAGEMGCRACACAAAAASSEGWSSRRRGLCMVAFAWTGPRAPDCARTLARMCGARLNSLQTFIPQGTKTSWARSRRVLGRDKIITIYSIK